MNREVVVLDGNHLAYRAYYKFPNLRTLDGVNTSIIYGIPYVCESLIRRLNPLEVIMVFDGGHSPYRKLLLHNYKKRDKKLGFDRTDFYRQKDEATKIMLALGVKVVVKRGWEADDLITLIAKRYARQRIRTVIVSGDKDFNQLIDKYTSVYNSTKGILYDRGNLREHVGYDPEQCLDYLSLCGDKSDNIPGYQGMGPKRTMQLLDKYGSIKGYLKSGDTFGKMDNKKLTELRVLNQKLIGLKYFYRKFMRNMPIPWLEDNVFDMERLKGLCRLYETNSFLKPQFLKTYKDINKWKEKESL